MTATPVRPENVHNIPLQSLEAAAGAQAKLPRLSRTEPSIVYVTTNPKSTPATVQIAIIPRRIRQSKNYLFKVFCRVALSHDAFDIDQLHQEIQRWYDTIGPGWWTIDDTCCTICQRPSSATRRQTKASNAKWLKDTALDWLKETALDWLKETALDQLEVAKGSKARRTQRDEDLSETEEEPEAQRTLQTNFATLVQIANEIVKAVREGQDQLTDLKTTNQADRQAEISASLQRDISECLRNPGDDVILALSERLAKARKDSKATPNMVSWLYWYLQGSLDKVDIHTREKRKESAVGNSVTVINSAFSRLLFSDGLSATSVPASLGALDHFVHWVRKAGKTGRAFISKLVAYHLHGDVIRPPAWYRMPNGPGWVNVVRNSRRPKEQELSFEKACLDLDLPNLSALDLEIRRQDIDNTSLDVRDVLSMKIDEDWASFEDDMKPELTLLRQLHALLNPSDGQQGPNELDELRRRIASDDLLFNETDQPAVPAVHRRHRELSRLSQAGTMRTLASLITLTRLLKDEGRLGLHAKLKSEEAGDLLGRLVELRQLFWLINIRAWLEMETWSEDDQDRIIMQLRSDEGLLLLGLRRHREIRKLPKDEISRKLRNDPDLARDLLLDDTVYHSFLVMAGLSLLEPEFLRCATTWRSNLTPHCQDGTFPGEPSDTGQSCDGPGFTSINGAHQIVARRYKRPRPSTPSHPSTESLNGEQTATSTILSNLPNWSAVGAVQPVSESNHALLPDEPADHEHSIPAAESPASAILDAIGIGEPPQPCGTINPSEFDLGQIDGIRITWEPWQTGHKAQTLSAPVHLYRDPYWGGDDSPGGQQEEVQTDWQRTNSCVYEDPGDEDMEMELPGL